jgi:hypothetical protein
MFQRPSCPWFGGHKAPRAATERGKTTRLHHVPGTPNPLQEAAFHQEHVVAIVDDLIAHPDLRLVKLADTVSLMRSALTETELLNEIGIQLLMDDDLAPVARRIAENALQIGTAPAEEDRIRRRGALLERLVHKLVELRLPGSTFHEEKIELTHNPRSRRSWTNIKEVVADGAQFEVYECKTNGLADIADIDELSDVATTAMAENTDPRPTIVTFGSEGNLRQLAKGWHLTEDIYGVAIDAILALRNAAPKKVIRPAP